VAELSLRIDGMHCGNCVKNVSRALERTDGVTVKRVDIGTAQVAFDPARASADTIAAAVTDAGYPAQPA
jgi:copper chaperone CopZ